MDIFSAACNISSSVNSGGKKRRNSVVESSIQIIAEKRNPEKGATDKKSKSKAFVEGRRNNFSHDFKKSKEKPTSWRNSRFKSTYAVDHAFFFKINFQKLPSLERQTITAGKFFTIHHRTARFLVLQSVQVSLPLQAHFFWTGSLRNLSKYKKKQTQQLPVCGYLVALKFMVCHSKPAHRFFGGFLGFFFFCFCVCVILLTLSGIRSGWRDVDGLALEAKPEDWLDAPGCSPDPSIPGGQQSNRSSNAAAWTKTEI